MAARQLVEAPAQDVLALDLEDGAGDLVHVHHDAVGVEHDQPVLDRLDDRLGLRLLLEHDVDARALDRDRGLARDRLEELALVERAAALRGAARAQREHADHAARGVERHVEPVAAGQRVGAGTRRLVVLPHPGGGRDLGRAELEVLRGGSRAGRAARRPAAGARRRRRTARRCGSPTTAAGRRRPALRRSAGEGVERRGARLALPRRLRLVARARRQVAGQHRDDQEDEQQDDVLRLGDGEREERLDEEEVVDEQAQHRRHDRRAEPAPHARRTARRSGTPSTRRAARTASAAASATPVGGGDQRRRDAVAPQRRRRRPGPARRVARVPRPVEPLAGDDPHVDVAAPADHLVDRRAAPRAPASTSAAACRG